MTRHDFAPHHHSLRKFPQRSQSLRVKSSSPSIQRLTPRWNGTTRSPMPSNRLIITNQDLVLQDTSVSSLCSPMLTSGESGTLQVKAKPNQSFCATNSTMPFNSMTLNRHQRSRRQTQDLQSALINSGRSASQSSTLFVNCSLSPNATIQVTSSDHNAQVRAFGITFQVQTIALLDSLFYHFR